MRRLRVTPLYVRYFPAAFCAAALAAGCSTGARLQLSAAESLDAVARQLRRSVDEFHDDVRAADDQRRRLVIDAFVRRIRADQDDQPVANQHVERFTSALDRLRDDAQTLAARRETTRRNLRVLGEVAQGLRRQGVRSMTADAELRRYLGALLEDQAPQPNRTGEE